MEKERIYRIKNPSQELLIKTIKTIPKEPVNGYIQFSTDGVNYEDFNNKDTYLNLCNQKNIIPYSRMVFNSGLSEGNLVFSANQKESLEKYFIGSKIESYLFNLNDISGYPEKTDFGSRLNIITKLYLPSLIEKGYEISKLDLWLDSFQSNARHGTRSPNIVIKLGKGDNKLLNLVIGPSYFFNSEKYSTEIPELERWFKTLPERVLF